MTLVVSGHDQPWLRAICDDILWLRDGCPSEPTVGEGHVRDEPCPATTDNPEGRS